MIKRPFLALALSLSVVSAPSYASDFKFSFDWKGLVLCTSGKPNKVKNPAFKLSSVPEGTTYIRFRLKDKDVLSYNHGGGVVVYKGQKIIAPGAFKYKSPCPPGGKHLYEWTATAQSKKSGGKLGVATAARKYP